MGLSEYNKKRDFKQTKEPKGEMDHAGKFRFVIQRHEARRLHYDFRIELGGVLVSWAVPKGPSMNSLDKRFAVRTEDHPVSYLKFKGSIPEGNYGGGFMEIWDKGNYIPVDQELNRLDERQALKALKKGELKLFLKGKQIQGGFVLIKLKDGDNWLLIKHKDEWNLKRKFDAEKLTPIGRKSPKKNAAKKKTAGAKH